jgi:hypothetical protein
MLEWYCVLWDAGDVHEGGLHACALEDLMSRKRNGANGRCDFDLGTSANVSAGVDLAGRLLSEFNGIVQELVVKELSTKGEAP